MPTDQVLPLGARLVQYGRSVQAHQGSIAELSKGIRTRKKEQLASVEQRIREECDKDPTRSVKVGEGKYYALKKTYYHMAITEKIVTDACAAVRKQHESGLLNKSLKTSLLDAIRAAIRRSSTQLKRCVRPVKGWTGEEPTLELAALAEALDACKKDIKHLLMERKKFKQQLDTVQAEGLQLANSLARPDDQVTVEDQRGSSRFSFKLQTRKRAPAKLPLKSIVAWWPSHDENEAKYLDVVLQKFKLEMSQTPAAVQLLQVKQEALFPALSPDPRAVSAGERS